VEVVGTINRKVAGGVLAGLFAVISAVGAMLLQEEPVRVMTYGPEYLAPPASDPAITTTTQLVPS